MTARQCVGLKIREARSGMGLTQEEFGGLVGLAESSVSLYENGKRSPDFDKLEKISVVTKRPMGWFFECASLGASVPPPPAADPNHDEIARRRRRKNLTAPTPGHPALTHIGGRAPGIQCQTRQGKAA